MVHKKTCIQAKLYGNVFLSRQLSCSEIGEVYRIRPFWSLNSSKGSDGSSQNSLLDYSRELNVALCVRLTGALLCPVGATFTSAPKEDKANPPGSQCKTPDPPEGGTLLNTKWLGLIIWFVISCHFNLYFLFAKYIRTQRLKSEVFFWGCTTFSLV